MTAVGLAAGEGREKKDCEWVKGMNDEEEKRKVDTKDEKGGGNHSIQFSSTHVSI